MKRRVAGLSLQLLAVVLSACNREVATGLPAMSASSAVGDNKLKDAVAFFTRDFDPTNGGLAVMNSDGSGRRPLAGGELGFEPSISPDGRQIAFSRNTDVGVTSIYVMNVDGTGTTEVAQGLVFNPTPRWSPDGCEIAFAWSHGDQQIGPRISIVNADGSGFHTVTPDPGPDFVFEEGPTWSPDGTRLAFTRNSALHVINVDGTGLTALPNEDMAQNAAWSPDGQRIAYFSGNPVGEIHMRNADGSNLTTVTSGAFDSWPRWSADGRQLVFSRFINDFVQVFTINVDGTGATGLTPAGVHDFMPDWGFRHSSTRCSKTLD
jgi:Tol biopolymer transport system component